MPRLVPVDPPGPAGDEAELQRAEADLAVREAAIADREAAVAAALDRAEARFQALSERLVALSQSGATSADEVLRGLPSLVPPPGTRDREAAQAARRQALAAREAALLHREQAAGMVSQSLAAAVKQLEVGEAEAARLTGALETAKREAAERAEAEAASRAAAEARAAAAARATQAAAPESAPIGRMIPKRLDGSEQRRASPRVRLDARVDLQGATNFYMGFAQNLSAGGLFVASFDFHPVGTEVEVAFSLPDGTRIETRATVRWVRDVNDDTPEVWPGMGLQFQALHPEAEKAIARFISAREPMFFPE